MVKTDQEEGPVGQAQGRRQGAPATDVFEKAIQGPDDPEGTACTARVCHGAKAAVDAQEARP
jgi:hypothetical protein